MKHLLQKITLFALFFLIPSNLFKTFFQEFAYVRGLQVDYLLPKLHITDLLLILLVVLLVIAQKNKKTHLNKLKQFCKKHLVIIIAIAIFTLVQSSSQAGILALLFILRITVLGIVIMLLKQNKQLITAKLFINSIQITLIFQSLLAWYQYIAQKSLVGYHFFGETNLGAYAGIAKTSFFGAEKILPYGTTAHPNILAGVLLIFLLFYMNHIIRHKKIRVYQFLIIMLSVSALLLTQSMSASLGLLLGSITLYYVHTQKIQISVQNMLQLLVASTVTVVVLLTLITQMYQNTSDSFTRRAYLNTAALEMFSSRLVSGVGLQNFTLHVETYSDTQEIVRFVQPVHSIFLLLLAETGLIGIILTAALIRPILQKKIKNPQYYVALLPIAALDHYLLTIHSGILLLGFVVLITQIQD